MIKRAVIDFSAFVGANKTSIIKELTIIDIDSGSLLHWIFKAPKNVEAVRGAVPDCGSFYFDPPYEKHNLWLSRHYHGLSFNSGFTDYDSLTNIIDYISFDIKFLYAPTTEKAAVLENLLNSRRAVVSLELLGCPPIPPTMLQTNTDNQKQCLLHCIYSPGFNCTQHNVHYFAEWCKSNLDAIDMNIVENRMKTIRDWKLKSPSPKDIADQGFVHLVSTDDTVKCIYCGVTLFRWEENDNVEHDHEYNSPYCKFLKYQLQDVKQGDKLITKDELFSLSHA